MSRLLTALVLATALAAPACDKKSSPPERGKQGAPLAAVTVPVAVFVDGKQLAGSLELSGEPRPLTALVPEAPPAEAWLALEAIDRTGKVHTTMAPARNEGGRVAMLARGGDGVELGFRLPSGTGEVTGVVHGVTRLTIKARGDRGQIAAQAQAHEHDHGGGDSGGGREHAGEARPVPDADLRIAITGARGESTFTGDALAALPVVKAPAGDTETPGWSLVDVLAAAGAGGAKTVHLTDGEGSTLQLAAEDFDRAKVVLYLKLNRSGVIRFRRFRQVGASWEVAGELRGLTKIHVVE